MNGGPRAVTPLGTASASIEGIMGFLIYDGGEPIELDDRTLAHLQVVIIDKLRRGEHFSLTLRSDHRMLSYWISPRTAIEFVYHGNRRPVLNHAWLEELAGEVGLTGVLLLVPEPVLHASLQHDSA